LWARIPLLYQLRPEIGEGARLAVVGRYVILFHIVGEVVRIERVIFGGRDLPTLFQ
jgi:toxin ParE1/3/4